MPSPTPYLKATLVFVVALTALAFFIWLQAPLMGVLFAGQVVFFSSLADRWKVVVALALVAVSAAVVITWLPDLLPDLLLSTLPLGALAIVYLVSRTSLADRWQMVVALALVAVFAAVVITFLPDTRLFILLFGTLFGALVIVQIMDPVFFAIRQQAAFAFAAMAVSGLVFITWSPLLHLLTRLSDLPSRLVNVLPQPLADLVPRDPPMESLLWALGFACALVAAVFVASPSDRRPRLQLGGLILAAWTVASLAVAVITLLIWHALGAPPLEPVTELSPRDVNSIATRAFAVIAGLGGVALLVISYRRQRTTEADGQRAEKAAGREDTKLFNERFTTAYTELGSEHAAVRLGAVHALARAADNAPTGRDTQMVIEVLCAYLRMPYTPAPEEPAKNASKAKKEEHRERELEFESFREVRHTVIRIIGDRLREVTRWRSQDYDFTGVVFDGGDLTGANFHFGKVSFRKARFTKGTMDFSGAEFDGGTVDFSGAEFSGGTVDFSGAEFAYGTVSFSGAKFAYGTVDFSGVEFSGGTVDFSGAEFAYGTVSFSGAKFAYGTVNFHKTQFTGTMVSFHTAESTRGKLSFSEAEFAGGKVDFEHARGECPEGLREARAHAAPGVLLLPQTWEQHPAPESQQDPATEPPTTSPWLNALASAVVNGWKKVRPQRDTPDD